MSRVDHSRPRFRRQGRQIEDYRGGDIPPELKARRDYAPAPSKASLREEAEQAVREFERRKRERPR